jgi:hypothetical protein
VKQTDIAQIVHELRSLHPDLAGERDLSDFEITLGLLPEGSVWRVAERRAAVFALAPGDRLFTVTLAEPPEPGLPCAATLLVARLGGMGAPGPTNPRGEFTAAFEHEPSSPTPPAPSAPNRQQVTDIWGNPIDARRHRRRR